MWRNSGQPVRVFMLDARACLPILCFTVYWSRPTLYIALTGVVFFTAISFFGLTLPSMLRVLRRFVVGRARTAVPVCGTRRRLA
jgi:intracellular multiplication protein IcmT